MTSKRYSVLCAVSIYVAAYFHCQRLIAAFAGALQAYFLGELFVPSLPVLLAIASGNFIYVSASALLSQSLFLEPAVRLSLPRKSA